MTDRITVMRDGVPIGFVWLLGIDYRGSGEHPISRGEVWRAERADDGRVQQFESQMAAEGWLLGGNE